MGLFSKRNKVKTVEYINPCYADGVGLQAALLNIQNRDAMTLSAVFAAVQLISNSIAELPIQLKTDQDNKVSVIREHMLYHIFDNCLLTKFTLLKRMVVDLLLKGNAFAYIERDRAGNPINLVYYKPGDVTIDYNDLKHELFYRITSIRKKIEPCDIIHLCINADDGINGKGIISYASRSLALSKYTEKAVENFFASGCAVNGILSTDSPRLTEDQRNNIKEAWIKSQTGDGSGMAVLEGGMKYSPVAANSQQAQMLETRQFNIQEIARFFGISPVLLQDLTHSGYNTIEAMQQEFVIHTLLPYVTLIENECNRKLIKPSEQHIYIDFDEAFIIKSDKQAEANYLSTLVSNGIITINEARAQMGFNNIEGGDKVLIAYTKIEDNTIGEQEGSEENNDTIEEDEQE